jgi:hypothetical protein
VISQGRNGPRVANSAVSISQVFNALLSVG